MLLPQETMFNESSTKLQSDGRPVYSSVGNGTLSADNVKSNQTPSASPCLVKCLLQRLCSLFRPSKCSPASNTHPTAEKMPASDPASIPQADKVSNHSTTYQSHGPKDDRSKEGPASSRPRDYRHISAEASLGPTKCKPPAQRALSGPREWWTSMTATGSTG